MRFPENLSNDISKRKNEGNFRTLNNIDFKTDFFSNDYLGYSKNSSIQESYLKLSEKLQINQFGSTGSRLISGNHLLFSKLETKFKEMLQAESALYFNSGYDANIGLLSAILKPKDVVFYDELCHASIRDGMQMGKAKTYKYKHNDYQELIQKIKNQQNRLKSDNIYIVTESIFSMDGDASDLDRLVEISERFNAHLIIDEAHALGVCGKDYKGLTNEKSEKIFARIYTCGKALGSHGGFVLGSKMLIEYLINFSRPFIYTTGASPTHMTQVYVAVDFFEHNHQQKEQLQEIISFFRDEVENHNLSAIVSSNPSAIQFIAAEGNEKANAIADQLKQASFGVKAILSPTVPKGKERIRICLHSFNTKSEIEELFSHIKSYFS